MAPKAKPHHRNKVDEERHQSPYCRRRPASGRPKQKFFIAATTLLLLTCAKTSSPKTQRSYSTIRTAVASHTLEPSNILLVEVWK